MRDLSNLSIDPTSTRGKILSSIDPGDFAWALPIMRTGYAGRGLVYLTVAGLSLASLFQGGQAQGTASTLQSLSNGFGIIVILAIIAGMVAYALWRLIDCIWDLEAYGTDAHGLAARSGMLITGIGHLGVGGLAVGALTVGLSGGTGNEYMTSILSSTLGRLLVALGGVGTLGACIYYLHKAVVQSFRDTLAANPVTVNYGWLLRLGVAAQGLIIGFAGVLLIYAAINADAKDIGGLGTLFDWLHEQPFGMVLVVLLCLGLLAFALFCFVNAAYRIIPKAAGDDTPTLTTYLND